MNDNLEYMENSAPEDEEYSVLSHGKRQLYKRAVMRLFVDERRVRPPFGFSSEVKTPKGKRNLYRVEITAMNDETMRDLISGLENARRRKSEVVAEHEVDGTKARYRIVRTSSVQNGTSTLHSQLLEGAPVIFDAHGRRVSSH